MLSMRKEPNNLQITYYVKGQVRAEPVYYTENVCERNIIPHTNNGDYIDKNIFMHGRKPFSQEIIDIVYQIILHGKRPEELTINPRYVQHIQDCYDQAMKCMTERIMTEFIAEPDHQFYPAPIILPDQRNYIKLSGCAGSGKSMWTAKFCESYHWTFPTNMIYMFSAKPVDKCIDQLPFVTRVPQSEWSKFCNTGKGKKKKKSKKRKHNDSEDIEHTDDEEEPEEDKTIVEDRVAKSLIIFDDIDHVPEDYKKLVFEFKEYVVKNCRYVGTDVILCDHMITEGQKTRIDLNECTALVVFPFKNMAYHIDRVLETYFKIRNVDARHRISRSKEWWIMICKCINPHIIVSEKKMYVLKY